MKSESKTILLVEDEAIVAVLEKRWLANEGFKIIHVFTGEKAIETVQSGTDKIDLILMDIDLGSGIDGTQAARAILKDHDIPLLFLSSHTESEIVKRTEEISSYGYVVKESSSTVLLASIRMAFKLYNANKKIIDHEKSLLESAAQYSAIFEHSPVAISYYDKNGQLVTANKACLEICGVNDPEELKKVKLLEEPNLNEEIKNKLLNRETIRQEIILDFELIKKHNLYRTIHSGTRILDLSITPLENGYIGQVQDITELKRAELKLRRKEENYYSIDFLDKIIEMSPHAIWISDNKGTLIKSNQALRDLLCVTNEELVGNYNVFQDNVVEEQGYMPQIRKVFEEGTPVRIMLYYDASKLRHVKSDLKEPIYLDLSISAIKDENGKVMHAIIQHINVTEAKMAEQKLAQNAIELQMLNATKDRLLSVMAHDLRGPLAGFAGLTNVMINSLAELSPEEILLFISTMNVTSKKLLELLTNILEWSRLQSGKVEFYPTKLDLYSNIEDIRNLFSSAAKKKSIIIKNEVMQNTNIIADQKLVSTILRNLISNAIKFTNTGGEVSILCKKTEEYVDISITDNGVGMSEEIIDKIFRRDSICSTKGTDNEEGSGFGIILCKGMLEKYGGELKVESYPGKGSVFTFRLEQVQ